VTKEILDRLVQQVQIQPFQVLKVQREKQVLLVLLVLQVQLETLVEHHLITPLIQLPLKQTLALENFVSTTQTFKLQQTCSSTTKPMVQLIFNSF